ncbi:RNA polymerase sigma-70 factor [uncultured Draconibacterium sp.]|uniref:RNA polymerase sigma factor n=1 Tax=uncultured Draconibacterium sp. TaxID=1573823 RepID=UPI003216BAB1
MGTSNQHIDYIHIVKLIDGDARSFDVLFEKYSGRLFNFALKYLKSVEDAEEVVQSVFLYIWEKRGSLKPEFSFNAYLFTIAHNIIKKQFLKKARDNAYKDEVLYTLLKSDNSLEKIIDYKYLLKKVEEIIEQLPPKRKEVFIKRKYQELPVKEIAAEMGISPNTVENHLSAAQKQILETLEKEKLAGFLFYMLFVKL